jgi:hypothetical protein
MYFPDLVFNVLTYEPNDCISYFGTSHIRISLYITPYIRMLILFLQFKYKTNLYIKLFLHFCVVGNCLN